MLTIQNKVNELKSINEELSRLTIQSKTMRKRVKVLEGEIDDYLEEKDQPGFKHEGMLIIRKTKTRRKMKKKSEQKSSVIDMLKKHGVNNPEQAYEDVMNARRQSPTEESVLKMERIKKKR